MPLGAKNSSGESSSAKGKAKNNFLNTNTVIKWLYWLSIAAGIWFAYLNIAPYAEIVKRIMLAGTDTTLIRLIASIPLINGIVASVGTAAHWIIGLMLWAIIQTIEVFPLVLQRDRAFMRTLIQHSESHQKFQIKDNDDPALASLKRWYNLFPSLTIRRARNAALFVYTIDFLICITLYPPCEGGFSNFTFILSTGQYGLLDYENIILLLTTLFIVELLIRFIFWLGQIAYFMREAHSTN